MRLIQHELQTATLSRPGRPSPESSRPPATLFLCARCNEPSQLSLGGFSDAQAAGAAAAGVAVVGSPGTGLG